ncbi:ethylbenzene dehydrogenase-related protein, partial [Phycisphaerales bacterium AB-hyl4]
MRTISRIVLTCGIGIMAFGCQASPDDGRSEHSEPQAVDQAANIYIPASDDLTRLLRVAVVYNDTHIQIRYEFATDHPSWYHDYLVYRAGEWQRLGEGAAGPAPTGLQEDRIAMMLDDGSVEGFAEYGGYVTMHPGVSSRTDEAPADVNKFLPASREGEMDAGMWQRTHSDDELDRLRDEGVFINTWQWRAHRSNPIGYADPGYVLDARNSAEGQGMYATNWDDEQDQPLYMFDPAERDRHALQDNLLLDRAYGQDDPYYL